VFTPHHFLTNRLGFHKHFIELNIFLQKGAGQVRGYFISGFSVYDSD